MRLRPESRPIHYQELGESQRKAFDSTVELLTEAVEMLREKRIDPASTSSGWLDSNRSNRLLFLSGKRGTGKSTILASLLAAEDENFFPRSEEQIQNEKTRKGLEKIRHRIVWLEPIDLETIPSSVNLLGAILARIEKAIEHAEESSNMRTSRVPGAFEIGTGYQDAIMTLQRLQTNLALAWGGNLQARAGHLDPDAFAVEVKRVEKSRLSINLEIAKTLDKLAEYTTCAS